MPRRERLTAMDVSEGRTTTSSPAKRQSTSNSGSHPPTKKPRLADTIDDSDVPDVLPRRIRPEPRQYQFPGLQIRSNERRASSASLRTENQLVNQIFPPDDENTTSKRTFALDTFDFFSTAKGKRELVPLNEWLNVPHPQLQVHLCGRGWAVPSYYLQHTEDIESDEDYNSVYLEFGQIIGGSVDILDKTSQFWIETQKAYYVLYKPSETYTAFWEHFYDGIRIPQLLLSRAQKQVFRDENTTAGKEQRNKFIMSLNEDGFSPKRVENALTDLIEHLESMELRIFKQFSHLPQLRTLLGRHFPSTRSDTPARRSRWLAPPRLITDNSVIALDSIPPTCVSESIFQIVRPYIHPSTVKRVGEKKSEKPPVAIDERDHETTLKVLWAHFQRGLRARKQNVNLDGRNAIPGNESFHSKVEITRTVLDDRSYIERRNYNVGDCALFLNQSLQKDKICEYDNEEQFMQNKDPRLFPTLFWVAIIRRIDRSKKFAHVQWFEHGSSTCLYPFDHPDELFLTPLCQDIQLHHLIWHVEVSFEDRPDNVLGKERYLQLGRYEKSTLEFMCRRIWNELTASFKKLPTSHRLPSQDDVACPQCVDDRRVERRVTRLKDEMGFHLEPEAFDIHVYDYIQYRSASGPASTGQVDNFHLSKGWISVQPMDRKKTGNQQDERELYFPGHASKWIELSEVIRKVHVLEYKQDCDNNDASARSAQQARYESRELWVNDSPLHFYVTVAISGPRLNFCKECVKKYRDQRRIESQVLDEFKAHPLRILDYCAGTGAFSLAIAEGSRCAKTDYAVEKGPSTAKTIKRNYPETTVINQDINDIFSQSSLKTRGKQSRILKQLCPIPNEVEIPPLPEVGKFDALVAGFPWSSPPHSHLNMFKRAHDPRNTLFLNVLSIIELHRFKYIFLENVPGFLSFSLGSRQDSPYRVTGGVQQGGLKIIYRVLLDLGYQVHCGLVQAGDLGLPQTRIRFFIVAALANLTLPDFPVPTHDFRDSPGSICRDLSFKLHVTGDDNRTIQARQHLRVSGTAPHPHISIRDSIYDLPRFDMKFSMPEKPQKVDWEIQHKLQDRKQISSLGAYPMTDTGCGPKASTSNYRSGPTTRFQMSCRLKPNGAKRAVGDLQHRTRRVNLEDARRIFLVPMGFVSDNQGDISTADYRAIPMEHRTWSLTNPLSWVARSGFRRGGFGRLNEQSCFQTIVTNVNVCAKQGQVLHPNQHRMVSIREVARAQGFPDDFYFVSENDNATVIFRQIGNAVPWPVGLAFGRELRKAVMKDWVAARSEEDFVMHDEFRRHFGPT